MIGAVSGYQDDTAWKQNGGGSGSGSGGGKPLQTKLLDKSASVRGFFLNLHADKLTAHAKKLATLVEAGLLDPGVDPTPFKTLPALRPRLQNEICGPWPSAFQLSTLTPWTKSAAPGRNLSGSSPSLSTGQNLRPPVVIFLGYYKIKAPLNSR